METRIKDTPWIRRVTPLLDPPSLKDNRADADRLVNGIRKALHAESVSIDLSLVKTLPHKMRQFEYETRAVLFEDRNSWRLIDIFPDHGQSPCYGLAVDLGTSTVVVRLLDLATGERAEEITFHNPQLALGADILSRIHSAAEEGGRRRLKTLLIDRLNQEVDRLVKRHNTDSRSILGMAAAGNTTMTHLFLGLDPYWICREPYIPVVNRPEILRAAELGLSIHPMAPVMVFPNVGSYCGGDLIAGILAAGMTHSEETAFLVDVGTNAEVVVGNRDWLMACAGAAGPALEGGVAGMGMMAGPGVIDKVSIDPVTFRLDFRTIGDSPATGICGSGLIDLAAHLFLTGMIDVRGKFVPRKCGDRLVKKDGVQHFVVVPAEESDRNEDIVLSQPDMDGLMRSKAAMYTILTTVSNTVNISLNGIRRFFVAGTFGAYIDPRSAITLGMIPDLADGAYVPLGNSSLEGASRALLSAPAREEAFCIRDQITYLELNVNQEFMNLFSAARFIPHTDKALFPSVKGP